MSRRIDSAALLLRSVPYREADLVATFFTQVSGSVGAIVRGGRRSTKRFGGALEPIHGVAITFEDTGRDLCTLKEARVERPRIRLTTSLEAMEAAGHALRWVRHLCPMRTPEPAVWDSLTRLLDSLDDEPGSAGPRLPLFGLSLLTDMGYALELDRCVGCSRPCPEGRAAFVDAARGGIVCSACGGGRRRLSSELRTLAARAQRGQNVSVREWRAEDARDLADLVDDAMAVHAGFEPV